MRSISPWRHLVAALVIAAGLTAHALASPVVLSNLAAAKSGYDSVFSSQAIAQIFTTSSAPAGWNLESITFPVTKVTDGNLFAAIFSNDGPIGSSTPGSVIGVLTTPVPPATGMVTYNAGGAGIPLAASTSYWVVWANVGSGQYDIDYTSDATTTGSWTIPQAPTGNAWGYSYDNFQTWDMYQAGSPFKLEITASQQSAAVPEIDPAGLGSVLALCTGALGMLERRRMKGA